MKQKHYISTQISVLTRDKRAKICTKIQAKTTLHYDKLQRSVLVRDIRAKICTKIEAKTTVHWYTNKCFKERYMGENMHEN